MTEVPEAPSEVKPNRATRRAVAKAERTKPIATFEQLRKKKPRVDEVSIVLIDDAGEKTDAVIRIKAIGSTTYDKMIADCPPTNSQRDRGEVFNMDTFAPSLISSCSLDPPMTYEQAVELYTSDEWAPGEIGQLFFACQKLCNAGLDVPFTDGG